MFLVFRFQFTKYTLLVTVVPHIFISVYPVSQLISGGNIMWSTPRPMRGLVDSQPTNQRAGLEASLMRVS